MRKNILQFELPDYPRFSFDGYDFDEADLGKLIFINNMKIVSPSGFSIRIGFSSIGDVIFFKLLLFEIESNR